MRTWLGRLRSWPYLQLAAVAAAGLVQFGLLGFFFWSYPGKALGAVQEWHTVAVGGLGLVGLVAVDGYLLRPYDLGARMLGLVGAGALAGGIGYGISLLLRWVTPEAKATLPVPIELALNPAIWLVVMVFLMRRSFFLMVKERVAARYERDSLSAILAFSEQTTLMDRDSMLNEIVARMRDLTNADACLVFLVDREADVLRAVAQWHNPEVYAGDYVQRMVDFPCPRGFGITGLCFANGEPILVRDTSQDRRGQKAPGDMVDAKTTLVVPIKVRGELIGVLRLTKRGADQISETQVTVATIFAQHAAVALEAGDLYHEVLRASRTDHLTGLPNARAFHESLERHLESECPAALLMIDADCLKAVNDRLGHQAGDQMLIDLARALRRHTADIGKAFRYAGDEFLVILPGCSRHQALIEADLVRSDLEQVTIATPQGQVRTTVSIGVAGYPSDARDPEGLLAAADRAMYAAKQQGKNQVCVAS